MPTPDQLTHLVFAALRDAESGDEQVYFDTTDFEKVRTALSEVPPGPPTVEALMELTALAGFIDTQMKSRTPAVQLVQMLESVAGPELQRQVSAQVSLTGQKVEAVGKRFDNFLGSRGEQLPDTGERLDPKTFKGPIRG